MDEIKHLFRQVSGSDYLLMVMIGLAVFYLGFSMDNRQRIQLTLFIVFLVFCIRLILGVSLIGLITRLASQIHFIYIWGPLSLTIFITSMLYEKGNLLTIVVRAFIVSLCICASLFFIFR